MMSDQRQPEKIIGKPGAHATACGRMPPMLHIAFEKLPARRTKNLPPFLFGSRIRQRHHILKLVAEAVSASRLIKRRPRPHPAAQNLIQKPAIEEQIERRIGRLDLNGGEDPVPSL